MDRAIALHVGPGMQLLERLQHRVQEKKKWKPGAWRILMDALDDEAQFMREGQVEAVCSYTLLALLCVRYLQENYNIRNASELCVQLKQDVAALSDHLVSKQDGGFAPSEERVMGMSIEGLVEVMQGLSKTYPGAL